MPIHPGHPRILRLRTLVILAGLLLAYALVGFALVPWIAKRELPMQVEQTIHHRARIGALEFNPFTLTLHAKDLAIEQMDGAKVVGLGELNARLQWRSIFRRAIILSELQLKDPSLHIEIGKDGRVNLAALIPPQTGTVKQPVRFAVGRIAIANGLIEFEDKRGGYRNRLERLSIELSSLSTLEEEKGPYALVGETSGGAKLRWKGEMSLQPIFASGTLDLEAVALPELNPYFDGHTTASFVSGRADFQLPYRFELVGGRPQFTLNGAKLQVQDLGIAARGSKVAFAKIGRIEFEGVAFDLQARRAHAQLLRVAAATLDVNRDKRGELDIARLVVPSKMIPGAAAAEREAGWQASIATLDLSGIAANFTDSSAKTPLSVSVRGLEAKLKFEAESGVKGVRVSVGPGELSLAEVHAGATAQKQPALTLTNLQVAGVRFDSVANTLAADTVRVAKLGVDATLDGNRLSLLDLVPAPLPKSDKPVSVVVKSVELADGWVTFADRGTGVALALERVTAKLSGVSSDTSQPLAFQLGAGVKSGGHISVRGSAVPAKGTLQARVEATALALAPLQPLTARYASVKLAGGEAALAGTLNAGAKNARLGFTGSARLSNIAIDDTAGTRLIGWKSLATDSLRLTLTPDRAEIDELRWTAPVGKLAIATDRTSNISRAFAREGAASTSTSSPAPTSAPAAPNAPPIAKDEDSGEAIGFPVAIRRVRIEQGQLEFSDASVQPGFVAKIHELAGSATGLSSDRSTRAQFALEGSVDEFGYASLSGSLNPFALRDRTNVRVQLRNLDLAGVTPYSVKFAGYRIASGHTSMDLNYRVRENRLEGDNKIVFDNLVLGEKVDSPGAIDLPIALAIAILKDSEGKIDIALPVTGNLNDPQFDYGAVIRTALFGLIKRIVTAPFRALAHLFGGSAEGDEAGAIAFDPGSGQLLPPEQEKIGRLVGVLVKRPEIRIAIPARYDAGADARALKRAALAREIGKRAGFTVIAIEEPGPISVDDRPTRAALRELFVERFSPAEFDKLKAEAEAEAKGKESVTGPSRSVLDRVRSLAAGDPQVADPREFYQTLVRRLRDTQPLATNALAELAQSRGTAIEAALKASGVDSTRIARSNAEPTSNAEAKQVTVQLALQAR